MKELLNDPASLKWLILGTTILALEAIGPDSLTSGVRRAIDTPVGGVAIPLVIAYTTLHFYDKLPHQPIETDAFNLIGDMSEFAVNSIRNFLNKDNPQ